MAAVRHAWMFRTAAVIFFVLGLIWLWRFGLTDYHPEQRPYGLLAGVLSLFVGVFLLKLRRLAIITSAIAAAVVALSAVFFIPNALGPGILFLAILALGCATYAVLAVRAVSSLPSESGK